MPIRTTRDYEDQEQAMEIRCGGCGKVVVVWHKLIARMFPTPVAVEDAERQLRCRCGHKGATIHVYVPKHLPVFPHWLTGSHSPARRMPLQPELDRLETGSH